MHINSIECLTTAIHLLHNSLLVRRVVKEVGDLGYRLPLGWRDANPYFPLSRRIPQAINSVEMAMLYPSCWSCTTTVHLRQVSLDQMEKQKKRICSVAFWVLSQERRDPGTSPCSQHYIDFYLITVWCKMHKHLWTQDLTSGTFNKDI